jgi:hypothetical protein
VVGEGFTLTFLSLHSDPPQISTTKINISIEIYEISSYFSIEIEKKMRNPQKSQKSRQVLISLDLGRELDLHVAIETKSRNLNLGRDFSIFETKSLKVSRFFFFFFPHVGSSVTCHQLCRTDGRGTATFYCQNIFYNII